MHKFLVFCFLFVWFNNQLYNGCNGSSTLANVPVSMVDKVMFYLDVACEMIQNNKGNILLAFGIGSTISEMSTRTRSSRFGKMWDIFTTCMYINLSFGVFFPEYYVNVFKAESPVISTFMSICEDLLRGSLILLGLCSLISLKITFFVDQTTETENVAVCEKMGQRRPRQRTRSVSNSASTQK